MISKFLLNKLKNFKSKKTIIFELWHKVTKKL